MKLVTPTSWGQLVENIKYKRFKNIEPLFIDSAEKLRFGVHRSLTIELETEDKKTADTLDPHFIPKSKLKRVCFIRSELNNLPPGFRIIPITQKETFKTIGYIITYTKFEKPGDILALWHEIGHILNSARLKRKLSILEERISIEPRNILLRKEYLKYKILDERNAWSKAVITLRKFRHYALDLEPGIDSLKNLKHFLSDQENLGGYQEELEKIFPDDLSLSFTQKPP